MHLHNYEINVELQFICVGLVSFKLFNYLTRNLHLNKQPNVCIFPGFNVLCIQVFLLLLRFILAIYKYYFTYTKNE